MLRQCIACFAGMFLIQVTALAQAPQSFTEEQVARGTYLVNNLGLCVDCHSPRGPDGQLIPDLHLKGAAIAFTPNMQMPWAPVAPPLAGLPANYGTEDLIHYLMTGERPNGLAPTLPPMPEFKLNREDAEAVTAYLISL